MVIRREADVRPARGSAKAPTPLRAGGRPTVIGLPAGSLPARQKRSGAHECAIRPCVDEPEPADARVVTIRDMWGSVPPQPRPSKVLPQRGMEIPSAVHDWRCWQ